MTYAQRLWAATICLLVSGRVEAQHVITVDATQPRQTMEGCGLSLSWFGNGAGGWSDDQRERVAKALFDRETGLGLNWIPGFLAKSGAYDWTRDERQRWMMKRAQAMGADLFEAISFSPPYWMTISGTSQGAEDGGSNMQRGYFGQGKGSFVDYLADVVQHYDKDWGITFRNVDPLNEPLPTWWKAGDQKQEGCHFSQQEQEQLIGDLGAVLARRGSATTIAAPDENNIDDTIKEVSGYSSDALSRMTQINTHSYAGSRRAALRDLAATDGKRLTMSEWGSSPDISGKDLATQIEADVAEMGVVDWAIWQPDWPAIMRVDFKKGDFSLTPMYWVYASFTRFIKPGYQIMATHDRSALAAYSAKDRTLVTVQQNWTQQDARITFNLSAFHGTQVEVSSYRANGAESLQALEQHVLAGPIFTVAAPAGSVTTYVIKGVSTYASDATGSVSAPGRGVLSGTQRNETAKLRFDARQAQVLGSFAPDAGMVAISTDGGAETYVDLYAPQRIDDAPMFSTPLLAAGKHTLEIRVSGLKAFASTGTRVTVSRVTLPLPALAVNDGQVGTGLNQVEFKGKWAFRHGVGGALDKHLHISETADDTFTLRFNGRGARVFTSTGPDRGIAAFAVDGLPETVIDTYAPGPQQDTFLYETPLGSPGLHTLKVRVLGQHDPLSSGNGVVADHVEILQ